MRPGHVPYGYRIKDGVGVICEEEAENIRKIYEMYLSGMGLQAIADALGLKCEVLNDLREMDLGEWEGLNWDIIKVEYEKYIR